MYNAGGFNYYELTGLTGTTINSQYKLASYLTPADAFQIDSKLDDGLPASGIATGNKSTTTLGTACSDGDGCCVDNGGTLAYDMSTSSKADAMACQMSVRF